MFNELFIDMQANLTNLFSRDWLFLVTRNVVAYDCISSNWHMKCHVYYTSRSSTASAIITY